MTKNLFFLLMIFALFSITLSAQTAEELKAQKAEKDAQIAALQGESNDLQAQIDALPGWEFGSLGTIGLNISQFTDWLGADNPNASSTSIGISGNAFANYNDPKQFWRNAGNLTYVVTKLVADRDLDDDLADSLKADFQTTADAINISSLYGYKLNDKWAISTLGEYRSTIKNFNDPGYFDIGAGATWTPIKDMVVVFHPLNYNFVMSSTDGLDYTSSLGCKIVADYGKALPMGVAWRTNLSAFVSYSDPNNLTNWTWVNSLGFTAWKGIGVGVEFGLRGNRQESYNTFLGAEELTSDDVKIDDFDDSTNKGDNPIQSYWLIGLTYNL